MGNACIDTGFFKIRSQKKEGKTLGYNSFIKRENFCGSLPLPEMTVLATGTFPADIIEKRNKYQIVQGIH
jgi:hypothetical protein